MKKDIQKEIEKTLNSLDGIQRAEAPAFFFTRVQARLEKRSQSNSPVFFLVKRPALLVAVLTVFVVMNVVLITQLAQPVRSQAPAVAVKGSLQDFAKAYGLGNDNINY